MTVYSKMVQSYPQNSGWCEYPDGHLQVRIFYSGNFNKCPVVKKSWCIFSVWGCDDTGMEINKNVSDDKEANKLINEWLETYHDMPKHLSMKWLEDRGFKPA